MGDMGDMYRAHKDAIKKDRELFGRVCKGCVENHPKRNPSILLPGQKCRWCGFIDRRRKGER